jgi:hypothetical protein
VYTDCRLLGNEPVNGIPTLAYQYSAQVQGLPAATRRI